MPELPITLSVLVIPIGLLRATGATLALAVGVVCLLRGRRAIWQTTLKSAWCWSLAALVAWSILELVSTVWPAFSGGVLAAARFMAITLSLCPAIALLGAKRPQAGAWNFVVLALWGILVLPALETLLLRPGQQLTLGVLRGGFLAVPVALALLTYAGTRYRIAAVTLSVAQLTALSMYWLPATQQQEKFRSILGLLGLAASLGLALAASLKPAAPSADRLWIEFRDTLGAFWALRVAERMNATALQHGWNLELAWSGFRKTAVSPHDDAQNEDAWKTDIDSAVRNTFRGLLRRFVSNDWIDHRIAKNAALPSEKQSGQ